MKDNGYIWTLWRVDGETLATAVHKAAEAFGRRHGLATAVVLPKGSDLLELEGYPVVGYYAQPGHILVGASENSLTPKGE